MCYYDITLFIDIIIDYINYRPPVRDPLSRGMIRL